MTKVCIMQPFLKKAKHQHPLANLTTKKNANQFKRWEKFPIFFCILLYILLHYVIVVINQCVMKVVQPRFYRDIAAGESDEPPWMKWLHGSVSEYK